MVDATTVNFSVVVPTGEFVVAVTVRVESELFAFAGVKFAIGVTVLPFDSLAKIGVDAVSFSSCKIFLQ